LCTQEGDYTRIYLRTSTLQEMNNDGDVDTNEDNCDLDYRAAGNLILKTTKAKVYLHREQSTHSVSFLPARMKALEGTLNNG